MGSAPNIAVLTAEHLAYLGQGEAELLGLEHQREPLALGGAVQPRGALTPRRQQALAFVEAKSPRCRAGIARHLADGQQVFAGGIAVWDWPLVVRQ